MAEPPPPADARAWTAGLDRRAFLRLAGAAAAWGALPTGCGAADVEWARPRAPLRVLSPRTHAVLQMTTARIVGPPGAAAIAAGRIRPAQTADAWLVRMPDAAALLSQGLLLLEFGVFPLLGKLRPFTRLDAAAQDAVLDELMRSRLAWKRALFAGVKSLGCLAFYADPAARPLTGYPGPFGGAQATIADAMRYDPEP